MNKLDLESQEACVLGEVLRRQAEAIPDAIYLMAGEDHYSFGRVNELANSYAAGLREFGVGAGDTVALFMGSSPECVLTTLGVNKLGAIWVPTNTDYRGEWLRGTLEDSRARILVTDAELLPRVVALEPELPFEGSSCAVGPRRRSGRSPWSNSPGSPTWARRSPASRLLTETPQRFSGLSGRRGGPRV